MSLTDTYPILLKFLFHKLFWNTTVFVKSTYLLTPEREHVTTQGRWPCYRYYMHPYIYTAELEMITQQPNYIMKLAESQTLKNKKQILSEMHLLWSVNMFSWQTFYHWYQIMHDFEPRSINCPLIYPMNPRLCGLTDLPPKTPTLTP